MDQVKVVRNMFSENALVMLVDVNHPLISHVQIIQECVLFLLTLTKVKLIKEIVEKTY
jgi:hypothetical protein